MTMSTQTLDEAARQMALAVLVDLVQILDVGEPVTTGINVDRSLTAVGTPIAGLVQTSVLLNAAESRTEATYSVKVPRGTSLSAGQAVQVITCRQEPSLSGKTLLIDKVSQNGLAMLRKAVASDFENVNQEGKSGL